MIIDWPRTAAKTFGIVTMATGVGFLVGALAFVGMGESGFLRNGPFGHIAEVFGVGAGMITASIGTFAAITTGRRDDRRKPAPADGRGLD